MKKLQSYISVMALLVLTACGGATVINPDKNAVDFTIEGGENTVSVSADGSWKVAECPEWVTTDIQDSTLVIKTARNETGAVREGNIVLTGKENVQAVVKVTQASRCTHITPATDKVEFEKEGGTQTVNIDTDGSPQVEAPE
ncbi:MAG: BACON domain-containing protein, partial [Muribaculaceae bacterium]|nr:BACON domain-containing protein [Muribaculaceae bacterium]